jgi:predicted CXXCH cytochrome family protein
MRQRAWAAATILSALTATALLCTGGISRAQTRTDSTVCASCHSDVWQTYRRTGMARAFYRPTPANTVEDYTRNTYYHKASDTYFAMVRRGNEYFQQQYQIGFDGQRVSFSEKKVDYILGSGNHVRAYVYRSVANTLVLLPLAWYSENGGHWGMNPGYDRPDHQGFGRVIGYRCMFCHNAYPEIPAGNDGPRSTPVYTRIPEGIDCQRCHGDGDRHVALARSRGARLEEIRGAIVNPARLAPERQMEVCMQCHLETTSGALPNSIVRYERNPFSYRPGQPLADFVLHFDHAAGRGYDDKFEITSAVYRLRKSQCFAKSNGALQCTTCHNPHNIPDGADAAREYTQVCRQCHAAAFDRLVSAGHHTPSPDCVGCHMPKRRTEDVVHVAMTDHYIQRRKPAGDLLAPREEIRPTDANAYHGPVTLYYPRSLPKPEDELYLAIAQVSEKSNLGEGIPSLAAAIEKYHPANAEYYLPLGDALRSGGRIEQAVPMYEEAARQEPHNPAALERQAQALMGVKQFARAEQVFTQALDLAPNAGVWVQVGVARLQQGRTADALAALEKAIALDPDLAEAYNSIGAIGLETGDPSRAETALRNAIRIQPNYAEAHNNLANLLAAAGKFEEAQYHFLAALRYKDDYFGAHFDYALALAKAHRFHEAQIQAEAMLHIDPRSAQAHDLLGNLLGAQGQRERSIEQFREAVRLAPEFNRANLDLGGALVDAGDVDAAIPYLKEAAQGQDTRQESLQILEKLGKTP